MSDTLARERLPAFDVDLFGDSALRDPFAHYRTLRDLGPVVWLPSIEAYAISRFADVQAALRSPEVLISGRGVGLNDIVNRVLPEPRTINSDGARHKRLRGVLGKPLMPAALREQRDMLGALISGRILALVDQGEIDAITSIAQCLPLEAISYLVGLPDEGRREMLRWASASFNSVAPISHGGSVDEEVKAALDVLLEAGVYFQKVDPATLRPGSWAEMLFEAADAGKLTVSEARAAISGLIIPSLDTTILAKGNLIYNLARNPDQWQLVREKPELVPAAVLEGVRHSAIVRWFTRYAEADYPVGDHVIPAGSRVVLMYGSANRDERHYSDPDRFDITRNPVDQLGWGTGPHMCAGMHLAKLEMEVMLEALVKHVARIEVGEPVIGNNRGLYGFDRLPVTLHSR